MKTFIDYWKDAKYAGLSDTQATAFAKEEEFNVWLYHTCKHLSIQSNQSIDDVYQTIDMADAKVQFIYGVDPENFKL